MRFADFDPERTGELIALFARVFGDAEGADAGETIGRLVADLIATTPGRDLRGFMAVDGDEVVGAIFFSRLTRAGERAGFLLSPVAVATRRQGQGIGQRLIAFGLERLGEEGVELAVTYGDPCFYSRLGFRSMDTARLPPPQPLSRPEGWLALSLSGDAIAPLAAPTQCVPAFDDPAYW